MTELPAHYFTFGNYNADIPTKIFMSDLLLIKWIRKHSIVGYCRKPSYKHIKDYVAVIFDLEEHGEYWSHIPVRVWDKYLQMNK